MERPRTYLKQLHLTIKFDPKCVKCDLGKKREYYNNEAKKDTDKTCAVGGAGPDDLSQVKLICISDFPGHYESRQSTAHPLVDIIEETGERLKTGMLRSNNAGSFLRMALKIMYKLDTYNDCWVTNALKCDPGKNKPLFNTQVKPCSMLWLSTELYELDQHVPNCPILVAGNQAFKAICFLYKEESVYLEKLKLNGCRRRTDLTLGEHPAIFTLNPARAARCEPKIETGLKTKHGQVYPTRNEWLYPPLPGSPLYSYIQDLQCLSPFLTNN